MATEDELAKQLAEGAKETQKLARAMRSTAQTVIKQAQTEKQREKLIVEHIKMRQKELAVERKKATLDTVKIKALEDDIAATEELGKSLKVTTTSFANFNAVMADLGMETKVEGKGLIKSVKDTALRFGQADQRIDSVSGAFKDFDQSLKFMGVSISDIGGIVDFNAGIFKQLAQSGATFGKNLINLRNAAHDARMPILDFVDLIQTNSSGLARLFGTVDSGVASIAGFTRNLRDRTMNELSQFGLNLDETSEFLGTVLELERARGNADSIRQRDIVSITVEYAKNLTKLSKLTGESVKELDENNKALAVNGAFQSQIAQMGPEEANRQQQAITMLGALSPAFGQLGQELLALGSPITETSRNITAMSPGIIDAIKAFQNGSIGLEELSNTVKTASSEAIRNGEAFGDATFAGGSFGEALTAFATAAGGVSTTLQDEMNAAVDGATKQFVTAKDTVQQLKAAAEASSTALLNQFKPAVGLAVSALEGMEGILGDGKGLAGIIDRSLGAMKVFVVGGIGKLFGGAKEFFTKGEDGKNFLDNAFDADPNKPGIQLFNFGGNKGVVNPSANLSAEQKAAFGSGGETPAHDYYQGSNGFQNFGSGTKATLHGVESVIPMGNTDQLLKTIQQMVGNTGGVQDAATSSGGMAPLVDGINRMVTSNNKVAESLNMLVMIGAKTEQNTKKTNINLAKMDGSLV